MVGASVVSVGKDVVGLTEGLDVVGLEVGGLGIVGESVRVLCFLDGL